MLTTSRSANPKKDALIYFLPSPTKDLQLEYSLSSTLNCIWEEAG